MIGGHDHCIISVFGTDFFRVCAKQTFFFFLHLGGLWGICVLGYLCSTKALHHNAVLLHSVHLAIHCSFL